MTRDHEPAKGAARRTSTGTGGSDAPTLPAAGPDPVHATAHAQGTVGRTAAAAPAAATPPLQPGAATRGAPTRPLVLAGMLAALTAVLAYLRIPLPFTPVPITGQTLGVMLSGLLLGPRWGFAAQLTYLLLGIAGVPVFAGGQAGLAPVMGPTGGYLLSYPLAAWLVGWLADGGSPGTRVPGFGRAFLAALAGGVVLVYAVGAPWFALHAGAAWRQVWVGAVLPFIPGDVAKAVVAAILGPRVRRALANPVR
ncbi:biotin transporter BioY [Thermaerobacter composti]|uniref:Biotin transporter BioY n=1 Tax=Thermaerobacter composti TaxID=554949 RepID=A0ABZ0QPY1_9FIRM|nr:biotin transporter BioY [Thermaerobacter composti]WPD19557.1 biotin transporter BioY [Thermaerobacter composti]